MRILATIVAMLLATSAAAQYPGPGYPSSGGGSGSAAFPITSTSGNVEVTLLGVAPTAGSFFGYDSANNFNAAYGLNISSANLGLLSGVNNFTTGAGVNLSFGLPNGADPTSVLTLVNADGFTATDSMALNSGGVNAIWDRDLITPGSVGFTRQSFSISDDDEYSAALTLSMNVGLFGINSGLNLAGPSGGADVQLVHSLNLTTARLQAYNESIQAARVFVNPDFGVRFDTEATKPTCDVSARGYFWRADGGTGVADSLEACLKDSTDAYAWRSVVGVLP